jgi:acyl transferase domain-containing protein/aryl carrier-like protein
MSHSNSNAGYSGVEIAIVGMAGRFPGADSVDALWRNVREGVESVARFSDEELRKRGVSQAQLDDPAYVKTGVPFEGAELFDASFFGYSPREAAQLDPQQRVFLECAWHALEHAGYDAQRLACPVGVYAGSGANLYLMKHLLPQVGLAGGIAEIIGLLNGNASDALSTRVAYKLDLRGPAVTIQTACSTSLVAVHMACQALLSSDCDMALAGGVWLNLLQSHGYLHQPGAILSSDGHCRAFDADADGTVLGSGAGIVVLKRLEDALRDQDTIHAIIKGSAANNDGTAKVGYTAPSIEGQAQVIRTALSMADVPADTIGYVEAHGTGTTLGDPIEVAALTQAFRSATARRGYCAIGSLKTNIGHLDAAAGVAGLIKAVMAVRDAVLPPSLHYTTPNPRIDFAGSPFYVNTEARAWPEGATPRRAGVSSFGMGGTNVHVVLEEAPSLAPKPNKGAAVPLLLSARNEAALARQAVLLADHLAQNPALPMVDVAHTLMTGRRRFARRAVFHVGDRDEAIQSLRQFQASGCVTGEVLSETPTVAFLFPGQGAQHVGMARTLYKDEKVFRDIVDACCDILTQHMGVDLRSLLYPAPADEEEAAERLAQTAITQPALFVIEYAMARWWMHRGLQPDAMLGHSIGEYVAACLAGVFSLEDALLLVAVRGRLLQSTRPGAMLAVGLPESGLAPYLAQGCDLAAVNAAQSCVLSGPIEIMDSLERQLTQAGTSVRRLHVSHAFHSAQLEPVLAEFEAQWQRVTLNPPAIPFVSNVTGDWITPQAACSAGYWVRHLRGTVRFAQGLDRLLDKRDRIPLEVGPGDTLGSLLKRHAQGGTARPVLSSQAHPNRGALNAGQPARCLAQLWVAGVEVDLDGAQAAVGRRVPLPGYPFERQSYWVAPGATQPTPANATGPRALGDWFHVPAWQRTEPVVLLGRTVPGDATKEITKGCMLVLGDATGLADRLRHGLVAAADTPLVVLHAGSAFARIDAHHYTVRPSERADYVQVLRSVTQELAPISRIAHLWSLGTQPDDDAQASPRARGLLGLLALAQALEANPDTRSSLWLDITLVTDGLEDVTGAEPLQPWKAELHGPHLVLPQELSATRSRLIDVDASPAPGDATDALATRVIREILSDSPDTLVALRGAHRWIRHFQPACRDAPVHQRLRHGGVYVITGGLGGVGMVLAAHLALAWQAKLVLLGRSDMPAQSEWSALAGADDTPTALRDKLRQLLQWQAEGAEVLTLRADVADKAKLGAALAKVRERFGVIHGVVHAAGVDGDGLLADKSIDAIASVFHAKVEGARVLLDAVADEPLDFVVLCSSLAAVAGGMGKIDYSAANACLDALAVAQRRERGLPVFSVNWDGWRDIGMAAGLRMPEHVGIDARLGAAAFERIVNGPDVAQTIVCTTALDIRLGQVEQMLEELVAESASPKERHARPANLAQGYVAPDGEVEAALSEIWSDLLGMAPIGSADNLFELGGDSLLAIQLVSRIRAVFKVEMSVKQMFAAPTLAELARFVSMHGPVTERGDTLTVVAGEAAREPRIPLSYAQQRLWFMWKLDAGNAAFNIPAAFDIVGELDVDAVRAAFRSLVSRHAVLRTVFEEGDDGRAWQVVRPELPFDVPVMTIEGSESEAGVRAHVDLRAREPFDLAHGPLLRAEVIRLEPHRHILLLVMHHIVTDGWSIRLMMRDFVQAYEASRYGVEAALPAPGCQYADFAVAQRRWLEAGEMERQADYWKTRLQRIEPLALPADLPAPALRTYPAGLLKFTLDRDLIATVKACAQAGEATPFMVLMGGMAMVLSERAGQRRFYVGTDMANRNLPETESMVGFFVNQVALAIDCATPASVRELLTQLQRTVVDAADHQDLPFDRLVEALRAGKRGSRAPLFQVKVIYQDDAESSFALPGLAVAAHAVPLHDAELDLIISFLASPDDVRVEVKYDAQVYALATIEDIRDEFLAMLKACSTDPDMGLDALRDELGHLRSAQQAWRGDQRSRRLAGMRSGLKARKAQPSLPL